MRIGVVLVTYNRPEYLEQCLNSLAIAKYPDDCILLIVDNCSTDAKTLELLAQFDIKNVMISRTTFEKNLGIAKALEYGYARLFNFGCDIVTNLDSDAIVKQDYIEKIINSVQAYPKQITTGFNSLTKNKDGSERHPIVDKHDNYLFKKSVGGINMAMKSDVFMKYAAPALSKSYSVGGNWDHMTCINSMSDNLPIVTITPSVVQHIGFSSAMKHNEAPDVADDFYSVFLPNVTLVCIDCVNVERAIKAIDVSKKEIQFCAIKLLTSLITNYDHAVKIAAIKSAQAYSDFVIRELHAHVDTEFVLIIQHDGYVINPAAWKQEFLQYDYIGATWWYKDNRNVGNGGFSLRSQKLLNVLASDVNLSSHNYHPEDDYICRRIHDYLVTEHRIKFAPEDVANQFSIEAFHSPANEYCGSFGFHGYNVSFKNAKLNHIPVNPKKTR